MTRPLRVSHAFHSPLMDPILADFDSVAGRVACTAPAIALVSNVTGSVFEPGVAPNASYWTRHLREPVRYADGVQALAARGHRLFVELGPKPVLTRLGQRAAGDGRVWVGACDPDDPAATLEALGRCYVEGCDILWDVVYPRQEYRSTSLPGYPFERKRYWLDRPSNAAAATTGGAAPSDASWQNRFVDVLTSSSATQE